MAIGQINWEHFVTCNNDARGARYKFEDLCRQIFTYEFISKNKLNKYLHSNPNNAGIESEPILYEDNNKYIGYQAKFFDNVVDYGQIKESAEKAVKHYKGKLDCIYLFCNKAITTTCASYTNIEKLLGDAGIRLVPITDTTILDLVRKYPALGNYYFDNHGITHDWFVKSANISASTLGERYNPEFNVDTEASKNLSVFLQDENSIEYFNNKKKNLVEEMNLLRWELADYSIYLYKLKQFIDKIPNVNFNTIHDVEGWHKSIIEEFNEDINEIESIKRETELALNEIQATDHNKAAEYKHQLNNLARLVNLYYGLEVSDIENKLLNNKILVVEGKAGIGKTQLFTNEAFSLLNDDQNALLVIGGDCLADSNILEQLSNNLRLGFQFEDIIDIMEIIGETKGRIVPILIDALNETWKPQLWKSVLPIIYNKIHEKKYVRMAISFRCEYEKTIIPEHFWALDDVVKMEHQGFRSNSMEATKKFLAHYGLPFTPIQMFASKIENPLFLTLYCKTYQGDDVGLQELYDRLLEKANCKIYAVLEDAIRVAGYDISDNLVSIVVENISKEILSTGKRRFEKNEIANLPIWNELNISARPFIKHLIQENILQGYEQDGKDYLFFAYDQMNDYYSAKAIMSMKSTESELKEYMLQQVLGVSNGKMHNWENVDLFVNVCALYAEKYQKECIDIIDCISNEFDKESIFRAYIESLEWRSKIYISCESFLNYCNKYCIDPDIVWNAFIINSVKINHLLNADALHSVLIKYPLNKRDFLWTKYINGRNSEEDRVVQLVELYNKGDVLHISNMEQNRLLLILFSWMLTSTNRWLRDTTSKAIIEILKNNFSLSEYLLRLFSNVNDPYVIQRLYGIVFGACTKKREEDKEVYKSLVGFVYEDIFNKKVVYPDILLRDYARLIIDCFVFEYPKEQLYFELDKIKPPYKSYPIPDLRDQKYSDQKFEGGEFYILHSMRFEGMGMYGDFGRYVFQSAVRDFEVDDDIIFNYAMSYILNDLGYKNDLFSDYDKFVARFDYDRHRTLKTERIGKKYQWIAMYNILARISDYCSMKNRYSMEEDTITYNGPWEPYVKDFDPTLNVNNIYDKNVPFFTQVKTHLKEAIQENNNLKKAPDFDEGEWIKSNSIFFEHQKNDLILEDEEGDSWIVLSRYADTGRYDLAYDKLMIWNWLYGYFVTDEQLAILKKLVAKKIDILSQDITNIPETYSLYNREYPWSSGSGSIIEWQYRNAELPTGETNKITKQVEEPDFSAYERLLDKYMGEISEDNELEDDEVVTSVDESLKLPIIVKTYTMDETVTMDLGKILNTTQDIIWEEEYDASKKETISYSHPCAEIINTLCLKQTEYDGYYYDENGVLIAFDTDLTKQKAGLVIRKSALEKFLAKKKLHLIWFVKAAKEIHDKSLMITNYKDWCGLLVYTGDFVEGEYYIAEKRE